MNPFSYPPSSLLYPPSSFPPSSSHPSSYPPPSSNLPPPSSPSLPPPPPEGGNMDLIEAVRSGRKDVVRYLLENGVSADFKSKNGKNALFYALEKRDREMIELLIRKGAKITNLPQDGNLDQEMLRFINEISINMQVLVDNSKGKGGIGHTKF